MKRGEKGCGTDRHAKYILRRGFHLKGLILFGVCSGKTSHQKRMFYKGEVIVNAVYAREDTRDEIIRENGARSVDMWNRSR